MEDKYSIMQWRNQQMYHLRQNKFLSVADQDAYFNNVVSKLFEKDKPDQILFSFLEGDKCIGYGGLVHINWIDKHAEISFIMDTALEIDFFEIHWKTYLGLIEKVAFEDLQLHKIFTYAFDLRPRLYVALNESGYGEEGTLKEHCLFEGKYIDVVIHFKFNNQMYLRDATLNDLNITHSWANHPHTRKFSFSQDFIPFEIHAKWFQSKLTDETCIYKILVIDNDPVGSIRFDIQDGVGNISYLVAPEQTGNGFGQKILELAITSIEKENLNIRSIIGLVKKGNLASVKIFERLQFERSDVKEGILEFKKNIEHADWI